MGVYIAGVLFAVGPFGRIAAIKEMVIDLADAARSGRVDFSYVRLDWKTTMVDAFGCGAGSPGISALPMPQSIFRAAACCISSVTCVQMSSVVDADTWPGMAESVFTAIPSHSSKIKARRNRKISVGFL